MSDKVDLVKTIHVLIFGPEILLLGIYSKGTLPTVHKYICTLLFLLHYLSLQIIINA